MNKICLLLLFVLNVKILSGGFDDIGNNARVISMGGANIALADAPYVLFNNPSGIYRIKNLSISSTYSKLYPGIEDDNLSYLSLSGVVPLELIGEFGIAGTFLNSELWKENTFIFSYARSLYGNFAAGASVKLLNWSAAAAPGENAKSYFGFTFDAGIHYTLENILANSDLRLGLSLLNITQPSIAENGNDDAKLPMSIGAGLAFVSHEFNYIVAVDVVHFDGYTKVRSGAEFLGLHHEVFGLNTSFLLRIGYEGIVGSDVFTQRGINGGFGLNINDLKIDYAYVFPLVLQHVEGSHKISLSYNFNF